MNDNNLTPRQEDVLKFIIEFKKTNGFSPTFREIQKGVCMTSKEYLKHCLEDLENGGYITMKPKSPRTIVVKKFIS